MRSILRLTYKSTTCKMLSPTSTMLSRTSPTPALVKLVTRHIKLTTCTTSMTSNSTTTSSTVLTEKNSQAVGLHTAAVLPVSQISATNMTTLVVGLGNHSMPATRHSVGMAIADQLCKYFELSWKKDSDCQGMVAMTTIDGDHKLILLKPRLLMNVNGRSVVKTVTKYKVPITNIFLLHDDLDRPLGKYSIKEGGSAGGHNGVKSVINSLGTNKMLRLRFGIDRPTNQNAVPDYVLEKFSSPEKELLPQLLEDCAHLVLKKIKEQTVK